MVQASKNAGEVGLEATERRYAHPQSPAVPPVCAEVGLEATETG